MITRMGRVHWVFFSLLLCPALLHGGTSSSRQNGQVVGYDGVQLIPMNLSGSQLNLLGQAYGAWNGCTAGGAPSFLETVGSGTGRSIKVTMVSGFNPENNRECGRFIGNDFIIHAESRDEHGNARPCIRNDVLLDVFQHEIGHAMGLKDGCQGVMQYSSWTEQGRYNDRSLLGAECTKVKVTNKTPTEQLEEECASGNEGACDQLEEERCTPPDSCSPIVFDLLADGFRFTSLERGTRFDINADRIRESISWIARRNDDALLAMDRNGNGEIDGGHELFGDATPMSFGLQARNGYQALFELDIVRGNGNSVIDAADEVYSDLLLWFDRNHDGQSQKSELIGLAEAGIETIWVEYVVAFDVDQFGNELRYRSRASVRGKDGILRSVPTVDVFFLTGASRQ